MSEVKQTIPGAELTSPCSCLVYWGPEGPSKNYIPCLSCLCVTTFVKTLACSFISKHIRFDCGFEYYNNVITL